MNKLCFIGESLYLNHDEALINSFHNDIRVVKYDTSTNYLDYLDTLDLSQLTQVGFFYHYDGFLNFPFFQVDVSNDNFLGVQCRFKYFSDVAVRIFEKLKGTKNNLIIDLVSCRLNKQEFKDEVKQIESELGINIRYSIDDTGNIENGGNWILESDNVYIRDDYFTNQISEWNGLLVNDIGQQIRDGNYNEYFSYDTTTKTFKLLQDISLNSVSSLSNDFFIELQADEVFDGQDYIIDLVGINTWKGLITISTTVDSSLNSPIIKNTGFINGELYRYPSANYTYDGRTLIAGDGYIIKHAQTNFIIDKCYSTGKITWLCGGMTGRFTGYSPGINSYFKITNCYSKGDIIHYSGGIVGACLAGSLSNACVIENCYSTGLINGNSGGIAAASDYITINNCYSTGNVGNGNSGGICGSYTHYCIINNCYSTGNMNTNSNGGITGYGCTNTTINNCYSLAHIIGAGGAGISAISSTNMVLNNCVTNHQAIRNVGTNYTLNNCTNDILTINNKLYSNWSSDIWSISENIDITVYNKGIQTLKLPILKGFKTSQWNGSEYNIPVSTPTLSITNNTTNINNILSSVIPNNTDITNTIQTITTQSKTITTGQYVSLNTASIFQSITDDVSRRQLKYNIVNLIFNENSNITNFKTKPEEIGLTLNNPTVKDVVVIKPGTQENPETVDVNNLNLTNEEALYTNISDIGNTITFNYDYGNLTITKTDIDASGISSYDISGTIDGNVVNETVQDGDEKIYGDKVHLFGSNTQYTNTPSTVGDPYITTLEGTTYKIYQNGCFRILQGIKDSNFIVNAEIKPTNIKQRRNILKQARKVFVRITKHMKKQLIEGNYYHKLFIHNNGENIVVDFLEKKVYCNKDVKVYSYDAVERYFGYNVSCKKAILNLENQKHGKIRISINFFHLPQIENGFTINIENERMNMKGLMIKPYYEKDMRVKNIFDLERKDKQYKLEKKRDVREKKEKWLFVNSNKKTHIV